MTNSLLTAEEARTLFDCDPETGILRWKTTRTGTAVKGSIAGCIVHDRYRVVTCCGKAYKAHRLVWLIVHGEWPAMRLDHRDGDRSNNRIKNLRLATTQQNGFNRKGRASSGEKNVYHHKYGFQVLIKVSGKGLHFGIFKTVEEAAVAARSARLALQGEFANHEREA